MPRADRRAPVRAGRRWSPWWLALPVLGIGAYAAFSATLALLGDGSSRAPSGIERELPRPSFVPPPVAAPATQAGGSDAPAVAPAALPSPAIAAVVDAAPAPTPPAAPGPSTTPAVKRAAADGARKVKPKRAPHEHLTEQDRRALDALVEKAGKGAH